MSTPDGLFAPRPALAGEEAARKVADDVVTAVAGDPQRALRVHQASDVDGGPLAQHHTLGLDAGQAAPGNHAHEVGALGGDAADLPGQARTWVSTAAASVTGITAEARDTSVLPVEFRATAGRLYHFEYSATLQPVGGPAAMDARIRLEPHAAGTPVTPTAASAQVAGASVPQGSTSGGSAAATVLAARTLACPSGIAEGDWSAAGFAARTAAGGGSTSIALVQPFGAVRQLRVTELFPG